MKTYTSDLLKKKSLTTLNFFKNTLATCRKQLGCSRFYRTVNSRLLCVHSNTCTLKEVCIYT